MKTIDTQTITRINTRDGLSYTLTCNDAGVPRCPHCGAGMLRIGDSFENGFCPCWWKGANEINYYAQVVVFATKADEDAMLERQQATRRESQQAAAERQAARIKTATDAVVGKDLRGVRIDLFDKFDGTKSPTIVRGVEGGQVVKAIGRHNMGGGNYQPTVIVDIDGHDYFVFIRHLIEVGRKASEIEQIEALGTR